jgi:hypothetical protein
MKFILFNVVVAAGLVFLLTGTDDPLASSGRDVLSEAVLKATDLGDQVAERLARANSSKPPEAPAPTPKPTQAAPPVPKAGQQSSPPTPEQVEAAKPPPFPPAIQVTERKTRTVPGEPEVASVAGDADAQVRQRRAEVLGEAGRKPRVTVEEGSELMSPSERRRELNALAEQMELFYIGQIGG